MATRSLNAGRRSDSLGFVRHDLHDSDRPGVGDRRRLEAAFLTNDRRDQVGIGLSPLGLRANRLPIFEWKEDLPESTRDSSSAMTDAGAEGALEQADAFERLAGRPVALGQPGGNACARRM